MMWVDTTLAGVMAGVQATVGTERFLLALQSEGRKSVEADWEVISQFPDFRQGFAAIATIAAVAGWGNWSLVTLDQNQKECRFRITNNWESKYQKALGVSWGSGMLAGKLAGYCSKLFGTNCWADQTSFAARGDDCDEFIVKPSPRLIETEIDKLLASDEATRADMAVALRKLEKEIAERHHVEEVLRQSEEKFRNLVETTSDWIWEVGADGAYTYCSPGVRALLGYEPADVVGRRPFDFMPADEAERVRAEFSGVGAEARPFFNLVNRNFHKDGRIVVLESSGVPRFDDQGNLIGYRGIDRDITERTRAETERLEMERRLLHGQKLESLGVLAGGIAHDFNNLLMVLFGNLELALPELPATSEARPFIEQALQAARRGADLTRQMLAYSGKGRFLVAYLDLSELMRENASLFRTAVSRSVTINLSLTSEASTIKADPGQVQQIVMNLITNASEAIGGRTGEITLKTGVEDFDEAYLNNSRLDEKPPPGRFAYIEVSDTGSGMDGVTQQRLFDPFFSTKFAGRGLGMAAVLGIVRGHKGAVMVQSAPGKGTAIRVLFPYSEAAAEGIVDASSGFQSPSSVPVARKIVLVVDDEEAICQVCCAFVGRLGFQSIGAANGEEALSLFKKNADEIGCVLLDLTMPHMDGISAFREMKRVRPDIPVILCSGYDEQEATQHFADMGLSGFLQKPFGFVDLQHKIERAFRTRPKAHGD
jgi:PAS domain S-box-containing protein